ncbi:MAG: bifunctional riboflavin kinase/FAD synthetase [Brasilonema octagenarum HA4186-MV1]|uniref:bifunctional riboflavin kinase/FAD synthetase n=1 Tax=Brasilonema octagenarum TaxID=417105 RepID=UPI001DEE8BC6|nr:bifunctional riboflavin kinase/FAD synthetase [Brasilonema octagenarum HA4186-MV1]
MLNLSQNGCSVWVTSSTELARTPTFVALGKFDGVHRGHQKVIQPILPPLKRAEDEGNFAETLFASSQTPHLYSTVVTFNPHPQEFFTGQPRTWLTPLDEKVHQLQSLGVEQLVLLPFDKELSTLSAEQFVEKILVKQLQAAQISVGQDFCFGSNRSGTALDLKLIAAQYGIPVSIVALETYASHEPTDSSDVSVAWAEETRISTSLIRQLLLRGDLQSANQLLGRAYTLIGTVIKGQQLGRTIGFPTANLQLPKDKFLPCHGVYAVRVTVCDETPDNPENIYLGVMNIGHRPTVNGTYQSVEIHLLDWSGDLYGKKLMVQLERFLRPEQKFSSLEALKTQIQQDCNVARAFFRAQS